MLLLSNLSVSFKEGRILVWGSLTPFKVPRTAVCLRFCCGCSCSKWRGVVTQLRSLKEMCDMENLCVTALVCLSPWSFLVLSLGQRIYNKLSIDGGTSWLGFRLSFFSSIISCSNLASTYLLLGQEGSQLPSSPIFYTLIARSLLATNSEISLHH